MREEILLEKELSFSFLDRWQTIHPGRFGEKFSVWFAGLEKFEFNLRI